MHYIARWVMMKRILIVGAGTGGSALLKMLHATEQMEIVGIVDINEQASGVSIAQKFGVHVGKDWRDWLHKEVDIIIEATGNEKVLAGHVMDNQHAVMV